MTIERIRRAALSAARSARSSIGTVLLVLAVSSGLLAMHDPGVAHSVHADHPAEPHVATATASSGEHADHGTRGHGAHGEHGAHQDPLVDHPAVDSAMSAGSEDAGSTSHACSLAGPACAMTATAPVTVGLAVAPVAHPRSAAVVADAPRGIRLGFVALPPPDLHLLSISRT